MVADSPATSAGDSPLARSATAKAAIWAGVASPAMISRIAQAASSAGRSSRASRRVSRPDQVGVPTALSGGRRAAPTRDRSTSATTRGAVSGSSGIGSVASACDQWASQRSGCAGDEHAQRRAVGELDLELPRQRHATGRLRLAVEDAEVDAALVHGGDDVLARLALDPGDRADVGRGPAAHRGAHGLPHLGPGAVDQDGGRAATLAEVELTSGEPSARDHAGTARARGRISTRSRSPPRPMTHGRPRRHAVP